MSNFESETPTESNPDQDRARPEASLACQEFGRRSLADKNNLSDLYSRFASVRTTDEDNRKLKVITPQWRPEPVQKLWQDPKMFSSYNQSTSSREVSSTAPDSEKEEPARQRSLSVAGRRLSLVSPVQERRSSLTRDHLDVAARRGSLTPLAYFAQTDAVEQFIEQAAVNSEILVTAASEAILPELEHRDSAEHFRVPRNSVAGGIKIEITPPSALKENNNFILETVVMEVSADETGATTPDSSSRIFLIQQLTNSVVELPDIIPSLEGNSKLQSSEASSEERGSVTPTQSIQEITNPQSSLSEVTVPTRRRTKLIAINVRRQTLSAVPRIQKNVRFAPSPTRGSEISIDDAEMEDRSPHLWTDDMAQYFGEPEELAMELDEPLVPGLLKSSDFSTKELEIFREKKAVTMFHEERDALSHFLESKFPGTHRKPLVALNYSQETSSTF